MFGKKKEGPTNEELIANLEHKMDIVEMLLEKFEKSEEENVENIHKLTEIINLQEQRNEERINNIEEKVSLTIDSILETDPRK